MVSPVFLASLVTVAPAMATLWYLLRRYESFLEDARIFFALVVGFFAGLAAVAFELLAFPFAGPEFVTAMGATTAFLFFVVGYAFFETGIKVMVLGLRRFRGRRDTPYYGATLGLGFGAMASLLLMARFLQALADTPSLGGGETIVLFTVLSMVPLGSVLTHGATGAWIGLGSAEGKLWKGWGIGTVLHLPVMGCYWLLIQQGTPPAIPGIIALGYGIALIAITRKRVLDSVVPPDVAARVRRDRRRTARGGGPLGAPLGLAADSEE